MHEAIIWHELFKEKGILDPYIRRIDEKKYLFMGAIGGVTLAKYIENNLYSTNYIQLNDYDLNLYVKLSN